MKLRHGLPILLLFSLIQLPVQARINPILHEKDSLTVYVFLLEECVISKNYTDKLKELYATFHDKKIGFLGLFPNAQSRENTIQTFGKTYGILFPMKTDHYQKMTQKLGASITPEVVVFDHEKNEIIYRGRIDNRYASIGKRRTVVSSSELEDVLKDWSAGNDVEFHEMAAIGCFIQKIKKESVHNE